MKEVAKCECFVSGSGLPRLSERDTGLRHGRKAEAMNSIPTGPCKDCHRRHAGAAPTEALCCATVGVWN